eukprot:494266-Prymnesium_polylepis.1
MILEGQQLVEGGPSGASPLAIEPWYLATSTALWLVLSSYRKSHGLHALAAFAIAMALPALLKLIGSLCWRQLELAVHRRAAAAEARMARLQAYSLGADDACANYDAADAELVDGLVDVDADERRKHAYADPRRLPNGGCLLYPSERGDTR